MICKKDMKLPLSIIILTFNEELNINECLKSICGFAEEIFIVDSYSNDKTLEIVKKYNCKIFQHEFISHSNQLNWAIESLPIRTEWVMKLDADETLSEELKDELMKKLPSFDISINGLFINFKYYFLGRWIKHGDFYPFFIQRVWRNKKSFFEERSMDEHLVLKEGKSLHLNSHIIHNDRKDISSWINKHNRYSSNEALECISDANRDKLKLPSNLLGSIPEKKRWLKENIYLRSPLFFRALFYFIYRYFFKLGFLDGREGLIFHFLQGFWYRFLVDVKIYEKNKNSL